MGGRRGRGQEGGCGVKVSGDDGWSCSLHCASYPKGFSFPRDAQAHGPFKISNFLKKSSPTQFQSTNPHRHDHIPERASKAVYVYSLRDISAVANAKILGTLAGELTQ